MLSPYKCRANLGKTRLHMKARVLLVTSPLVRDLAFSIDKMGSFICSNAIESIQAELQARKLMSMSKP
jgi:hypothetical protein